MNFQHYFYLFLRFSWLIVLLLAAVLAGTWVWLDKQQPVYASRAVLEVQSNKPAVVDFDRDQDNRMKDADAINTVIQSLSSNTLMLAVAQKTGRSAEWAAKDPSGVLPPSSESALAGSVREQLNIALRRGTRLIDIVAEAASPEDARELAATVVNEFLLRQQEEESKRSQGSSTFLVDEVKKLKDKLEQSDKKVVAYRETHKVVSVLDSQNIVVERLNALNTQVTEANTLRATLESDLDALKGIKSGDVDAMLKLKSVAALPDVVALRTAVLTKEGDFARIQERYLQLHPKYGAAQSELAELRSKLKTAVASAGDTLRQQYASFVETETKLKSMLNEQEEKALALDALASPFKVLVREAETDRTLYETMLTQLKQSDVIVGLSKTPFRLNEEPLLNPLPVRPNKTKILLSAALLGLAAGVGLVLLMDRFDSSIRTVDEAEEILELPVLAAIPEADLSKIPAGGTCMTDDSGSSQAEAFRTLRASLSLLGEEEQRRLILVTSAIPSEGKTFNSINLGAAFATQGLRTLLIDADLRRPALSSTLLSREDRKDDSFRGLTDVISGLCKPEEAVRATAVGELYVLPSGRRAPNPSELLAQPGVSDLLQFYLKHFDRIVVDSAPINAVSDSLGLAPMTHAVCLVMRYGKTPRRAILRALTLLEKAGARMAGVVMNRMPTNRGASYYYYYYGDPYLADTIAAAGGKGGGGQSDSGKSGKKKKPRSQTKARS